MRRRESELGRLRKENELLLRRVQEQAASQKNDAQASELLLLRERTASLEEVAAGVRGEN